MAKHTQSGNQSRRDFLKLLGLSFVSIVIPNNSALVDQLSIPSLGRITRSGTFLYKEPSLSAEVVRRLAQDELFPLKQEIESTSSNGNTSPWYQLGNSGFSPAKYVQPVRVNFQVSVDTIPGEGKLGEVTVPYVDAFSKILGRNPVYRFYYSSTFWILERIKDDLGKPWYRVLDDRYNNAYFVRANAIRIVEDSELEPISPEIDSDKKWILVDLTNQTVQAYEDQVEVFFAKISSGTLNSEGYFYTPKGQFRTYRKRPCRHMVSLASNLYSGFDLPGVPWVSYFTGDGIAFHGAYWHNNFGTPMSHGCINMKSEDAKWIYRWTLPVVPPDKYYYEDKIATRVKII